eukprot:3904378-Pleurochrysis_carterae.AAC.1
MGTALRRGATARQRSGQATAARTPDPPSLGTTLRRAPKTRRRHSQDHVHDRCWPVASAVPLSLCNVWAILLAPRLVFAA